MTPEQMLIATCLAYPDAVTLTRGRADAEDFIDPRYQHLYTAILTEYAEAGTVNPITVHQRATTAGLRGVELVDLYRWQEAISSAAVAPTLADQVRDGALRYRLGLMVGQMHQRISDTTAPVADSVSDMLAALTQIRDGATGGTTLAAKTLREILATEDEPEDWVIPGLFERGDRLILTGYEGLGKALALDTPIPTPNGWTTMGDLTVGQFVFDADGKPTRVLAATDVMLDRECFRVTFSDGSSIIADGDHLWETYDVKARESQARARKRGDTLKPRGTDQSHKRATPAVRTTREIRDTLRVRGNLANHSIPTTAPVEYPAKEQPIHPYLLGAWLGDGYSAGARIVIGDQDAEWMVGHLESLGYPTTRETASPITYGIPGIKGYLRALGVLGNKHIPADYLQGSVEQRVALLQGLMDTDGTIGKEVRGASICEFCVVNERLARDVHELLLGLGVKVTFREAPATLNGRVVGTRYRLAFQTDLPVFAMPRKAARLTPLRTARARHRYITSVEPVESVPVRCITVDNPRALYLAGREFIPTHNTTWLRQIGICAAAGLNPVTLDPLDRQIRVLFVDVENSERQWRRETRGIAVVAERGGLGSPRDYVHVHTGARMDLRKDRDLGLVHRLVDQYQPEILVIGPLYRLTPNGINNDEEAAPLIAALDTLRDRGLVLAMEAHAPKGSMGERNLAPRGSAALMGWPEFGFGLAPQDKDEAGRIQTAEVVRWRGDRDRGRQWPKMLWAGGPFPWTADEVSNSTRQALYAR